MKIDIVETCGECHWFVDKDTFTCCHLNPPQFQLSPASVERETGKKSWWTFPYVGQQEPACSYFEPRSDVCL